MGQLIGRRGHTIDAVQLICYRAAQRGIKDRKRVVVDAAGYRERRSEMLERQADRAAERALETGKEIELEPMSANERKVVHDHLKDRSGLETFSEGEGADRCVIVAPLVSDEAPAGKPASGSRMSDRIDVVLRLLASDHRSLSSVRDPQQGRRTHVADSLTGLEVEALRSAGSICDVGAGAGFPGLVLADELPEARVDLIESVTRKCEFMREAIAAAGFANARVIEARSEDWAAAPPPDGGRAAYDCVTARAVARLATLAELASPLLREGGVLVAWKGRRDEGEEAELARRRGGDGDAARAKCSRWGRGRASNIAISMS